MFALFVSAFAASAYALTFQSGSNGAVMWASDCDFTAGDIGNALSSGADCGGLCVARSGCTHFTWTSYNSGTCWFKGNSVNPVAVANTGAVCGIVVASGAKLADTYNAANIMSKVNFFTGSDPTHGTVAFQSASSALASGLASVTKDPSYFGVDHTNVVTGGRPSVRWSSSATYNAGSLFIFDIAHMPEGCGTWPALWLLGTGQSWPYAGEIDIIENVNVNTQNAQTLHTSPGCSFTASQMSQTGTLVFGDCNSANGANGNSGCGVTNTQPNSYGSGFNSNGGGVYATSWTNSAINIWFFPRNAIPADILAGVPIPASWGTPSSNWPLGSSCSASHFSNMQIILDTTFCGDWAGAAYGSPCTGGSGNAACEYFVKNYPSAFGNAYWLINALKVYQL